MLPFKACGDPRCINQLVNVLGFQYIKVKKSKSKFGFQGKSGFYQILFLFCRSASLKKYI